MLIWPGSTNKEEPVALHLGIVVIAKVVMMDNKDKCGNL